MIITLTINGKPQRYDGDPEMPLLWLLRDELDLKGTKFGCGMGPVRCLHRSYQWRANAFVHHVRRRMRPAKRSRPLRAFPAMVRIRFRQRGQPSMCHSAGIVRRGR